MNPFDPTLEFIQLTIKVSSQDSSFNAKKFIHECVRPLRRVCVCVCVCVCEFAHVSLSCQNLIITPLDICSGVVVLVKHLELEDVQCLVL